MFPTKKNKLAIHNIADILYTRGISVRGRSTANRRKYVLQKHNLWDLLYPERYCVRPTLYVHCLCILHVKILEILNMGIRDSSPMLVL